ncbi:MAG TPA: NAD(+)/NADH kinase [Myxococcota bacterium]|jgi:NAD+ kinase
MEFRSIGVCVKPDQPQLADSLRALAKWAGERSIEVVFDPEAGRWAGAAGVPRNELAARVELIVVLGGDGTLLAVARAIGRRLVPILGVNLGALGFLAEIDLGELFPTLEAVLADRFRIESRMRFEVSVDHEGAELARYLALNDAVIAKTELSRIVDLETRADGFEVTTYHADGLIVATPTGSSAYSLSAGGPLLLPSFEAVVLTPICSHTLTQRPLVLSSTCEITVRVQDARGGVVHLTVDGQVGRELGGHDRVTVRRSEWPAQILVPKDRNRFQVMRTKLRWGAR